MRLRHTFAIVILMLVLATTASAQTRGWGVGAGALDGDFGFQLRKDFWLGGEISQITGQASVYFQHRTTYRLDADYHFILNPGAPGRFYPLAGLDLAFNSDAVKVGINAGGGVNFMLTERTAAFAEAKFVIAGFDGFAIYGGIYF